MLKSNPDYCILRLIDMSATASPESVAAHELRDRLQNRLLVVFDGECGFCNGAIRWLLKRDRNDRLRFAPSSDPAVAEILASHGYYPADDPRKIGKASVDKPTDTILVLREVGTPVEDLLVRSNAILACLKALPQPWRIWATLLRLFPRPIRESAYRFVAANRYRLAGRYDVCPMPTPTERAHFL
jgi:predicted DCC family thiol-disulfide oxidoreductase YuxK